MPNGLSNWTYGDVVDFLKEKNFALHHVRGSHFYFRGVYEKKIRMVTVPRHGNQPIKPRTIKGIILQSGIPQKEWIS